MSWHFKAVEESWHIFPHLSGDPSTFLPFSCKSFTFLLCLIQPIIVVFCLPQLSLVVGYDGKNISILGPLHHWVAMFYIVGFQMSPVRFSVMIKIIRILVRFDVRGGLEERAGGWLI